MRRTMKPLRAAPLALFAMMGLNGAAIAQSADQIINALKPSGNLANAPTRGLRLGGAQAPAPAPAPAPSRTSPASAPAAPKATTAAPVHAPVATPPQVAVSGPSVNLTVNFPSGSAELTPTARASLDALGKALSSNDLATFRFRIEGHTDNVGSRQDNLELSQRRAEAVCAYLTGQYNVAASRLEPVGMGQEHPVIDTPPQTPEARNRRVQVINLGT